MQAVYAEAARRTRSGRMREVEIVDVGPNSLRAARALMKRALMTQPRERRFEESGNDGRPIAPFKRDADKGGRHEIALAFDDNRLASLVFGHYDQNIARIERRLGVIANANGNQVVIRGPREACEQARRVLRDALRARQARPGGGRGRRRRRDRGIRLPGHAVSRRGRRPARQLRRHQAPAGAASCAPATPRRTAICARCAARARVRRRPGRHRQDLARRRPRGLAAGAGRRRAAHPVAPGGRGRRAARLPARRHEGQGRSLPAARSTTRCTISWRAAWSSAACRPA